VLRLHAFQGLLVDLQLFFERSLQKVKRRGVGSNPGANPTTFGFTATTPAL
jgi:hypothetical protein